MEKISLLLSLALSIPFTRVLPANAQIAEACSSFKEVYVLKRSVTYPSEIEIFSCVHTDGYHSPAITQETLDLLSVDNKAFLKPKFVVYYGDN